MDRKANYWNPRCGKLGAPQPVWTETSDEGLEPGAIQSLRDHRQLALAAPEVEFTSHKQNRPSHVKVGVFLLEVEPVGRTEANWRKNLRGNACMVAPLVTEL
jgi:hypothetical protein